MKWRKLGMVWQPDGKLTWAKSHAAIPTPLLMADGGLRIYVQLRGENNIGRVGFVDLDPDDPMRVIGISQQPVLDIGEPGTFDDNGVCAVSVMTNDDGAIWMYYVGFELCHHIRYRLFTGLAISTDGGHKFFRYKTTPILERSPEELHFRCGTFVLPKSKNCEYFRMWYVAGKEWENIDGKSMPVYDMRYLESANGKDWPAQGKIVLPLNRQAEHGFGRPYVVEQSGLYKMFYSIRHIAPRAYGLGYAESKDGINWQRKDEEMGLKTSENGWDSDSIEYSAVIEIKGKTYCFYNGNDFGGTGFGVAELV